MREQSIKNCTNPKNIFNSTHQEACLIAGQLRKTGLKNLLYWIPPIEVESVILLPTDGKANEKDNFEIGMFTENGALYEVPMNHYLSVKISGRKFLVNAGYIGRHFFISQRAAYRELKRLMQHAINNPPQAEEECEECSTNSSS
jgi:hypothetical protein